MTAILMRLYVVQGYYGPTYGWEDLVEAEDKEEARQLLKDYNDNEKYKHRMIIRRAFVEM
jgi:hypothetical protein